MTTKDEERQVPEVEGAFATLIKKFGVGAGKSPNAETIAENISRTGGEFVYEEPERLAERLAAWHEYITPTKRKQILEQWFAEKGIEVPKEALKTVSVKTADIAAREEEEQTKKDEQEKRKSKFFYDDKTEVIRGAKEGETGMTWDEAEKVADRAKADKKAKEDKLKKGVFTMDKDGNLQVVEGAALTAEDVAIMNAVGKAQAAGDTRSAFEILEDELKQFRTLQELTGSGKKEGGLLDDVQRLKNIKEILGPDKETNELLALLITRVENIGKDTGQSDDVKALTKTVEELKKKLEDTEKETLKNQLTTLRTELASARAEFRKELGDVKSKDEYGIMSDLIKTADKRFSAFENGLLSFLGKKPLPLAEGEKNLMKEAIGQEAERTAQVRKLGEKLFIESAPEV